MPSAAADGLGTATDCRSAGEARPEGGRHRSSGDRAVAEGLARAGAWRFGGGACAGVHGAPASMLAPASTEEVVEIVRLAAEHRVPLVPQGGNTGMAAGATPPADGSELLLSLRRMNRIRSISAENRVAVAEAGVILETLHQRAQDIGMRFPLTLGARGSCTFGGNTSTNAGGTQVLKFGTMRSLVAGVEAVLPDGSIHNGLSGLK